MQSRTKFGTFIVLACMSALAACTSGGTEPASKSELEVIFPNGTLGGFELGRVTADVRCVDLDNEIGLPPNTPDPNSGAFFETDLEFDNEDSAPAVAAVYHGFYDLLGDCTFGISAYEPDGELFCYGEETITVNPNDQLSVQIMLNCDVSQEIEAGTVDLEILNRDIIVTVGNFCPFFRSLEMIPDDIPLTPSADEIPNPAFDGSWNCTSAADCVTTCNTTTGKCDPVENASEMNVCAADQADAEFGKPSSCGNRCDVATDPNRLTLNCSAQVLDDSGLNPVPFDPPVASNGIFRDPSDEDGDGDSTTYDGFCSQNFPGAEGIPPSRGYFLCSDTEPGKTIRITCEGGDGDEDCDKSRTHDIVCAGLNQCDEQNITCDDSNDCTLNVCDPTNASCSYPNRGIGDGCNTTGGGPGTCQDTGASDGKYECVSSGCETDPECNEVPINNVCTESICDVGAGTCGPQGAINAGGQCNSTTSGVGTTGTCVGVNCVDKCANVTCTTNPTECVSNKCNNTLPGSGTALCEATNDALGSSCDGGAGECDGSGNCFTPVTYNFFGSLLKAYNDQLPAVTGSGDPSTDCSVPDLAGIPNCLIFTGIPGPSGVQIGGNITILQTGASPDTYSLNGVQLMQFSVLVSTTDPIMVDVDITTDTTATITGTGVMLSPGIITITGGPLATVTNGNVNCAVEPPSLGDFACGQGGFVPGDNPIVNEPGTIDIAFVAISPSGVGGCPTTTCWSFGAGPAALSGYADTGGGQFLNLSGLQTAP